MSITPAASSIRPAHRPVPFGTPGKTSRMSGSGKWVTFRPLGICSTRTSSVRSTEIVMSHVSASSSSDSNVNGLRPAFSNRSGWLAAMQRYQLSLSPSSWPISAARRRGHSLVNGSGPFLQIVRDRSVGATFQDALVRCLASRSFRGAKGAAADPSLSGPAAQLWGDCENTDHRCARPAPRLAACSRSAVRQAWRKRWDSNPRNGCPLAGFQDQFLKPLGHSSCRAPGATVPASRMPDGGSQPCQHRYRAACAGHGPRRSTASLFRDQRGRDAR